MSKQFIEVFVGTVGAGKSTQINLLYSSLTKDGYCTKKAFLKTGHLFAYILEILLVKLLLGERKNVFPLRALINERTELFRKLFRLWLFLDAISITARFLITIYLPIKFRRIILVEEYFPAIIADYFYLATILEIPIKNLSSITSFMFKLQKSAGPIQTFFLDAPNYFLMDRWINRASLMEELDYLRMQRTLLMNISKQFSQQFVKIKTDGVTKEETCNAIRAYFNENQKND